jgi:hypothetical protein
VHHRFIEEMSIFDVEAHYKSKSYRDDLIRAQNEKPKIIECLQANVSDENKEIFRKNFSANPFWVFDEHLGYGMYIRNVLRKNGLCYDDFVMDDNWITWTLEAFNMKKS